MAYLRNVCMSCCYAKYICLHFHTTTISLLKHGSAGVMVIGDEILKGQVADTNSYFIAKHLFDLGIKVNKITVVRDQVDEIADEVQMFSRKFSYVVTTGGIGPTHDDVTFGAVAKAFGEEIKPHPDLVKLCADFFHTKDLNSPAMKLAHVPESAKLTYGYDKIKRRPTLYPVVSVHNVYMFPGIPDLMERLFLAVYKKLFQEGCEQLYTKNLYLGRSEVAIADFLNAVVLKYPDVTIGSYPKMFNRYYQVHLTIQSEKEDRTEEAYRELIAVLPKESVVNFDCTPTHNAYKKVMNISMGKKKQHIQEAINTVKQLCDTYGSSEIFVIFNGDPGSTVMTHLVHACLRKDLKSVELNGVNFETSTYSTEVERFIMETRTRYQMRLNRFSGSFDVGLKSFVDSHPDLKIVFAGCNSHASGEMLHLLNKTEELYPTIKWVNVLEKWTTTDIWDFIYSLCLPYCTFFDSNK